MKLAQGQGSHGGCAWQAGMRTRLEKERDFDVHIVILASGHNTTSKTSEQRKCSEIIHYQEGAAVRCHMIIYSLLGRCCCQV